MCIIMSQCLLRKSADRCTALLPYLMVLKTISVGCGVRASLMLFLIYCVMANYQFTRVVAPLLTSYSTTLLSLYFIFLLIDIAPCTFQDEILSQ